MREIRYGRAELEIGSKHFIPRDYLAGVDGGSPHNGGQVGKRRSPGFVVRLVLSDCAQQHVPLDLIGADFFLLRAPGNVVFGRPLVLVGMHGRCVDVARELCSAFCAVDERREFIVTVLHGSAVDHRLGAVGKGVLDGVVMQILAAIVTVRLAPAQALGRDRPGVLDPAALVHLVNHHLDKPRRGNPQEEVGPANLPKQLVFPVALEGSHSGAGIHTIGADQLNLPHRPVANLVDQCLPGVRMSAHQSAANL